MKTQTSFFKGKLFAAILIGAFGGMAPKLIELIPQLFADRLPSTGMLFGFFLLALFGAIIVIVYHEENLQKALILGAGAPALISALIAQAAAPKSDATSFFQFPFSIVSTAYAQQAPAMKNVKLVIQKNESPFKLNTLWISADSTNIDIYKVVGDTVVVSFPAGTSALRIKVPSENSIILSVAEIPASGIQHLSILNNQQAKDFWQTFGGKSVPQYRIEKND